MTTVLIGAWALLAALFIGWLLWWLDRWAARGVHDHVSHALGDEQRRRDADKLRHPAARGLRMVPACRRCGAPIPFGPAQEHVCGGGAW